MPLACTGIHLIGGRELLLRYDDHVGRRHRKRRPGGAREDPDGDCVPLHKRLLFL